MHTRTAPPGGGGLSSKDYIVPVRITLHEFTEEEALAEPKEPPERARRRQEIRENYTHRASLIKMCHRAVDDYTEGNLPDRHAARNEQIEDLLIDIILRIDDKTEATRRVLTKSFRGY